MLFYPFNDEGVAIVEQLNAERQGEVNSLMYEVQSLARELGPCVARRCLQVTGPRGDSQ